MLRQLLTSSGAEVPEPTNSKEGKADFNRVLTMIRTKT